MSTAGRTNVGSGTSSDPGTRAFPVRSNIERTFASATDVDNYTFTAPIGTTKLTLTGGAFTVGFVTNGNCLPVLTGQTAVTIAVSGAPKSICLTVVSPKRTLSAYTLVKQ